MRFRKDARLDTGQVQDRRGMSPGGLAVGGGGLGVVGIVVFLLLTLLGGGGGGLGGLGSLDSVRVAQGGTPSSTELQQKCQTGEDANKYEDCAIVADVNSIQTYWSQWFRAHGKPYQESDAVFFSGSTQTGCGGATAEVGPFYCPEDKLVYIDLGFFDQMRDQLGAEGGPFAEAYVLAHEYGHHAQDLLGDLGKARAGSGAQGGSVRVELQADCYAGVWARNAVATRLIEQLTDEDVRLALDAAASVGDDRIQARAQGQVNPETWTHGSSAQRQQWFRRGFQSGSPDGCDTFSGSI